MKKLVSLRWLLVFSIAVVWLLAPVVLALVVVRNAEAGLYGARDIVLIPIVSAGISAERRPISFILGDQDPLCSVGVLYRFAASAAGPVRVSVLSGNHGLEDPALSGSAKDMAKLRSARLAGALAAEFVAQYAQQNAP
jgi:hypothetical protein